MSQVNLTLDFDQLIRVVEHLPEKEKQRLHECLHKPRPKREDYFKIVGLGKSGVNDISENHDKYIGEVLADEHLR